MVSVVIRYITRDTRFYKYVGLLIGRWLDDEKEFFDKVTGYDY